jgi:hypothetical protein
MKTKLTPEAQDYIRTYFTEMSGSEMARILNVGNGIVIRFCRMNNLAIPKEVSIRSMVDSMTGRSISTPEIDGKLRELYLSTPVKTLAKIIGKSDTFTNTRLRQLGLIIPRKIIEKRKRDSRIKKGNIPPNKGKKMDQSVRDRIRHTWFPKGHLPKNAKHDGYVSIRIDSNGHSYAHIRTSQGKFDLLHRHIWCQVNGEIPDDKILTFKNGDSSDIRIENLELITRKENLFRNRFIGYPIELRETARILINLKKAITDYEKQRLDSAEKSHV